MTLPVFLPDNLPAEALAAGDHLRLDGAEGDHARRAMRLGVGEQLEVSDGTGLRLRCRVAALPDTGLDLEVLHAVREPAAAPRVTLVQALAKQGRDEMAVEISTELGVDRIVPWQANRSIVRWAGPKAAKNQQKWENLVRAAAKQARRAYVPSVDPVVSAAGLGRLIAEVVADGGLALVCDEEATEALPEALKAAPVPQILLIVGPEGGVAPEERELFAAAGARLVLLGPTVLRASTAGAAALTAINYLTGRWSSGRLGDEIPSDNGSRS